MKKEGLCRTCAYFTTCIFSKVPPVWQCEEFSSTNGVLKGFRQTKIKRVFSREAAIESE